MWQPCCCRSNDKPCSGCTIECLSTRGNSGVHWSGGLTEVSWHAAAMRYVGAVADLGFLGGEPTLRGGANLLFA